MAFINDQRNRTLRMLFVWVWVRKRDGRTDGLTWVGQKRDGRTDGRTQYKNHDGRTESCFLRQDIISIKKNQQNPLTQLLAEIVDREFKFRPFSKHKDSKTAILQLYEDQLRYFILQLTKKLLFPRYYFPGICFCFPVYRVPHLKPSKPPSSWAALTGVLSKFDS